MTLTKHTTSGIISLSNRMVNRAFCLYLPGDSQQKLWAKRPSRVMLFSALPSGLTAWQITRWGRFAMKTYKAYEPPQKQCNKCQEWKSIDMFYNSRKSTDGKQNICKECFYLNRPAPSWTPDLRACLNCQSEFIPTQSNQVYCCPQCNKAYYKRGRFLIFDRDEFRCIYCGMSSVEDATQLHIDHIIPRDAGGEDIAENLVTACVHCNLEKSCRLLEKKNIIRLLAEVKRRNLEHDIEPRLTIRV